MKSKKLNAAMRITGSQDPIWQLFSSVSIPGNNAKVTKYAKAMDSMYGKIRLETLARSVNASVKDRQEQAKTLKKTKNRLRMDRGVRRGKTCTHTVVRLWASFYALTFQLGTASHRAIFCHI